jgi:hypothetical protein
MFVVLIRMSWPNRETETSSTYDVDDWIGDGGESLGGRSFARFDCSTQLGAGRLGGISKIVVELL